jgi:hypothetical protein
MARKCELMSYAKPSTCHSQSGCCTIICLALLVSLSACKASGERQPLTAAGSAGTTVATIPDSSAIPRGTSPAATPESSPAASTPAGDIAGQTWKLCTWLGPLTERPGIYGTDLGFEAALPAASNAPDQLQLLFGDTYAEASDYCSYLVGMQDDLAARISRERPATLQPGAPAAVSDVCAASQITRDDPQDPTSWRRMRLFPDTISNAPERALDTGILRAPVTAWSDGDHSFVWFYRDEYSRCDTDVDCPSDTHCTAGPQYTGKRMGGCQPTLPLVTDPAPEFCREDSDCVAPATCVDLDRGVCVADAPFVVQRDGQSITPTWYTEDPRDGIPSIMHIASAYWPERPEDWATGFRFATNKFINATARTVAHFDPEHPELNDYAPGNETLLLWCPSGKRA